jgi:hypothetical protein
MSKLFGGLIGKLGLLVGAGMIAGGVYFSAIKKDDFGENFKRQTHVIEISNENYSVPIKNEFKKSMQEKLRIMVELDKKNNILYIGNYTQDYDRKDWSGTEKELLPTDQRHIGINHVYSKTFILHPPEVKITNQEQIAFLIPNYSWDKNLTPYEEHKEAQMAIEGGEKIIDWALEQIPIPFFRDFIEQGIENATEKEEEKYYETLFEKTQEGYTATIIPSQIPNKIFGYTETARESKIYFDTSKLKEKVQIYLWTKIALGNPTISADNSFPNKYGELENVVIEFSLEKKEIESVEEVDKINNELDWYFLQGKELEGITLVPKKDLEDQIIGALISKEAFNNPLVYPEHMIELYKNSGMKNIKRGGIATYTITPNERFNMLVVQFESDMPSREFIGDYFATVDRPIVLKKDHTYVHINIDTENLEKEQLNDWVSSFLNYDKRIDSESIWIDTEKINRKELIDQLNEKLDNSF